jgi:protein SDA1
MDLISRLIGIHKLLLFGFYDFMISYLKPHQQQVTQILAYMAQASHDLVPPDIMEPVVRTIASNFIWSNCTSEAITAGLNSLREICSRCPLAMPEELLQSLLDDYKKHRDKGPLTAARSLLALYREFNPKMLKRKDRGNHIIYSGKQATMAMKEMKVRQYGHVQVYEDVLGGEFLEQQQSGSDIEEADDDEINESGFDNEDFQSECSEQSESEEVDTDLEDADEAPELVPVQESEPLIKKPRISKITMEKILTDEDFSRIRELKEEQEACKVAGLKSKFDADSDEEIVGLDKITRYTKKKDDYEARLESIKQGREGRRFGSSRGKEERSSKTNKEKSKKTKPMQMMVHKRSIKNKKNRSLAEKQKILRAHITKQKKKGF